MRATSHLMQWGNNSNSHRRTPFIYSSTFKAAALKFYNFLFCLKKISRTTESKMSLFVCVTFECIVHTESKYDNIHLNYFFFFEKFLACFMQLASLKTGLKVILKTPLSWKQLGLKYWVNPPFYLWIHECIYLCN